LLYLEPLLSKHFSQDELITSHQKAKSQPSIMLRLFTTSAVQAATFPFTRVYRGIRIVWNDRVHRSVEGDEISDMAVDKNISELMADGIAEIQHR